ncbi:MAG: MFS transporter [Spirosomataceae bacterium]
MTQLRYLCGMDSSSRIYTSAFWLLCLSSFLFSTSFSMMIPELPAYLTGLGGAEYKGLIIALFTLMAGISRPFSGKLTDTIGRIPIMAFGSLVCFICGFLYPILTTVAGFLFLRFVHGFSTGFKPTGTSAYIADIIPENRRGEALGLNGLTANIGMSAGPPIGSWIADSFSLNAMFYVSSGFALLSIVILMNMKETLTEKQRFSPTLLLLKKDELVERDAFQPAIVYFLTCIAYGAVFALAPDLSEHIGIHNKGLFFSAFTLSSLAVRFLAGKASDRWGRVIVVKWSLVFYTIAIVVIAFAHTPFMLMVGAAIFGVGLGMNSPAIFAWAIDISNEHNRGKALATVYIALEAGIGCGSIFSVWLYDNNPTAFTKTFLISALFSVLGLGYLFFIERNHRTKTHVS